MSSGLAKAVFIRYSSLMGELSELNLQLTKLDSLKQAPASSTEEGCTSQWTMLF